MEGGEEELEETDLQSVGEKGGGDVGGGAEAVFVGGG